MNDDMEIVDCLEVVSTDEWGSVANDICVWAEGNNHLIHEIWIRDDGSLNVDMFDGPDAL